MVDVFISYKRDERAQASKIARRLQNLGLDVWFDDRIATGTQFDAEIEKSLREAKAILVLWSPKSVASDWVRNEAAFGLERGNLVAVMLAPCELPLAFRSAQYEPLFDRHFKDDHPGWVKVVERTKDLAHKRAEVEVRQSRVRVRRKVGRTVQWIGAWLASAFLLLTAIGYVMNRGDIQPGMYLFGGNWPGDSSFLSDSNHFYFHGAGTWEVASEVVGDHAAARINYVLIECRSEWGACIEYRTEIMPLSGISYLTSSIEELEIRTWTDQIIVARSEAECFTYSVTVSRDTESITGLQTRPDDITERPMCTIGIDQSELPQRKEYRLIDGSRRELANAIERGRTTLLTFLALIAILGLFALYRIIVVWRAKI